MEPRRGQVPGGGNGRSQGRCGSSCRRPRAVSTIGRLEVRTELPRGIVNYRMAVALEASRVAVDSVEERLSGSSSEQSWWVCDAEQ